MTKQEPKSKPEAHVQLGHIEAAIWTNALPKGGEAISVSIYRKYRDKSGEYKNSGSYSLNDLALVEQIIKLAREEVQQLRASRPTAVPA